MSVRAARNAGRNVTASASARISAAIVASVAGSRGWTPKRNARIVPAPAHASSRPAAKASYSSIVLEPTSLSTGFLRTFATLILHIQIREKGVHYASQVKLHARLSFGSD
jgi:hypothetical protein